MRIRELAGVPWRPTWQTTGGIMSARSVAVLAAAGAILVGCGTGSQTDDNPGALAGLCADSDTEVAEGEPGLDTAEEAIEAFVMDGDDFLANATFEGQQIIYEGEVVGRMSVSSMPAGGYLVTSAEWCYPEDY